MMARGRDGNCTSPFLQAMDPSTPRIVIEEHCSIEEDRQSSAASPLPLTQLPHPGEEEKEEEEEGGASTFAKLVRTIQFIKRWAGRGERPPDPREAFLDRFKVHSTTLFLEHFVTSRSFVTCSLSLISKMAAPNIDDAYVCPGEDGGGGGEVAVRPRKRRRLYLFNPSGMWLYLWLVVITVAVLYNSFLIIVRETFDPLQDDYLPLWLTLDYLADSIYIVDMLVQFFTSELCVPVMEGLGQLQ